MKIARLGPGALLMTTLLWSHVAYAQGAVHLKDGTTIEGEVVELRPGVMVRVRTPEGRSKVIDWSVVREVDDGPAPVTPAAVAPVAAAPVPAAAATVDEEIQGTGSALVEFQANAPGAILQEVTGHAFAQGYYASVSAVSWRNLCMAPCKVRMAPGFHELRMAGAGPISALNASLRPGRNTLVGKRGNSGVYVTGYLLFVVGLSATLVGAAFIPVGAALDVESMTIAGGVTLGAGVPMLAAGIPMFIAGRSKLEQQPTLSANLAPPLPPMLRWSAAF